MTTYRVDKFFAYARARHQVYLNRNAGLPREKWTKDKILKNNRFTNVFRELDKTTQWFRKNVRDPLRDKPEVLLATLVFRMFNRIEVGEAIFCQQVAGPFTAVPALFTNSTRGRTAFEIYCAEGEIAILRNYVKQFLPRGPYTTGAYIISSPPGHDKLNGVLKIIDDFAKRKCDKPTCGHEDWHCTARWLLRNVDDQSLEKTFNWLRTFDYTGRFHSYEIVTDLRHTDLLRNAKDVTTWANMGPGARRGLNRIHGRKRLDGAMLGRDGEIRVKRRWGLPIPEEQALEEMRHILKCSRMREYWPQDDKKNWPAWELRDVEHTLCEFDKMERVRLGEGKPRGSFP